MPATAASGRWRSSPPHPIPHAAAPQGQHGLWSRMSGLSSHTSRVSAASMRLIHLMRRGRRACRRYDTWQVQVLCLHSPRLASLASYGGGARRITAPAQMPSHGQSVSQSSPNSYQRSIGPRTLQDSTTRIHTKGHVACEQPYAKLRGITEHELVHEQYTSVRTRRSCPQAFNWQTTYAAIGLT